MAETQIKPGETQGDLQEGLKKSGLSMSMAAYFLVAQMVGAGFLSLPRALANTGWLGVAMMVVFCVGVGFCAVRLGHCWIILEERWPDCYADSCRQPYMDIAFRAYGETGRKVTMAVLVVGFVGISAVYILLIPAFMNNLVPALSTCEWLLITAAALLPLSWLGTPKDFWQASLLAMVATMAACIIVIVEIIVEREEYPHPEYPNPTITSFALGFGAFLFAFGGVLAFPTIQNDMSHRAQFSKSIILSFSVILLLYLPLALAGYVVQGDDVQSNILLSINTDKGIVKAAIVMEIINLLGTYIIGINPLSQILEESFNIEKKFGWQRCLLRSSIVLIEVIIGLAVPDFDKILNLVGGSTLTICSFILPPLMYMQLVDQQTDYQHCPQRSIELWERLLLWMIVIIGAVAGILSTVTAFMDIINLESFATSCFADFHPEPETRII